MTKERSAGVSPFDRGIDAQGTPAAKSALLLFAHGSRDPQWAEPFRAIQRKVAAARHDLAVEVAFLEIMEPSLPDAVSRLVAAGHTRITIAPLFMARGAHLKRDLAAMIESLRTAQSGVELALLPAAGEVDEVLDAIGSWVAKHV
jgi:sirohydrochlorin cobaltochelatase